jgi:hypothetical protein
MGLVYNEPVTLGRLAFFCIDVNFNFYYNSCLEVTNTVTGLSGKGGEDV